MKAGPPGHPRKQLRRALRVNETLGFSGIDEVSLMLTVVAENQGLSALRFNLLTLL
jgi:hypothetical protein